MSNGNHHGRHEKGQTSSGAQRTSRGRGDTKENRDEVSQGQRLSQSLDPAALDALSSLRATLGVNAFTAPEEPAAGKGECAHTVLTTPPNMPLTGESFLAPVVPTGATPADAGSAGVRHTARATGKPPYSTDPEQPRSDLLKRTRSSLATEVRRVRRECAETRRKLREAQARIDELEGAHHA